MLVGLPLPLTNPVPLLLRSIYCDNIQPYKARYGMPVALLLEGHVWWYVRVAISAFEKQIADSSPLTLF